MAKRRKKYQFDEEYPMVLPTHSFEFNWCCGCGLRHISFFEVQRGKTPREDKVKVYCVPDENGTDYRRDYERLKKRK